jgi:hypothetical protein
LLNYPINDAVDGKRIKSLIIDRNDATIILERSGCTRCILQPYPRKSEKAFGTLGGGGFKCVDYSNYVNANVLCTIILRICKYIHILYTVLHYVHINVVFLTIGQNSLSRVRVFRYQLSKG